MPYPSTAIANAFLSLPEVQAIGGLTQMQLQKLVYMAHGWNMAINGNGLVSDDPEAWTYGPVFRDLYDHTKGKGTRRIAAPLTPDDHEILRMFGEGKKAEAYRAHLTEREEGVIRSVWKRYGALSGIRLSELTHQPNAPWFKAITERGRNAAITPDLIEPHYQELLRSAQSAAH